MDQRESRIIWCQDQYRVFSATESHVYVGREKSDQYYVYEISKLSRRRRLIQFVSLESEWYWDPSLCRLVSDETTTDAEVPMEDVLRGYGFFIEDLSNKVEVREFQFGSGAQAISLAPKFVQSWIVSLHGGPESWEGREIRYGGLYRDLLRQGFGVIILNYAGSKRAGAEPSPSAWGKWRDSIVRDFQVLIDHMQISAANINLIGVSFGAALALILHRQFQLSKTILSSPLLDLENQRQRAGEEFADWFNSRFSAIDFHDFSFANLTAVTEGKVHVLSSEADEVLGRDSFCRLYEQKSKCTHWNLTSRSGPHAPQTYSEYMALKSFVIKSLSA